MHWYAQFGMSRHGRSGELATCGLCGATDQQQPCQTCRAEGRRPPLEHDWSSYCELARVHPRYAEDSVGSRVPCGDRKCQTPLRASVFDEGAQQ